MLKRRQIFGRRYAGNAFRPRTGNWDRCGVGRTVPYVDENFENIMGYLGRSERRRRWIGDRPRELCNSRGCTEIAVIIGEPEVRAREKGSLS